MSGTKKTNVRKNKLTEAMSLDVAKATQEERAAALLVLEPASIKIVDKIMKLKAAMEIEADKARQTSMFDDETFSNSVNTLTLTEEVTPIYSIDKAGIFSDAGLSGCSIKHGDFIEQRTVFREKKFIKAYEAGTLSTQEASHVTRSEVRQTKMTLGEEKEEN